MTNGMKLLILAASAIIVCVVCGVGFYVTREGKSSVNNATSQFTSMSSSYNDVDKSMYDGLTISGTELVSLIESYSGSSDFKDGVFTIKVITLINQSSTPATSAVYPTDAMSTKKSDTGYINPTGKFDGKVTRNENGIINNITFKQTK